VAKVDSTQFSQGALYEIGSALSFFQIREFAVNVPSVTTMPNSERSTLPLSWETTGSPTLQSSFAFEARLCAGAD
jgi:hypothetical protein